ncbi:MAG: hypothetical protein JWN15_2268 [Firmicutes bacterium]|nr:hypothetical protein [Bacillota bacterium]
MAHFREHVGSLVGKNIRLGRGGPDERKGTLVTVKDDYLTLFSEDGALVHYPLHHLKSITELVNGEADPEDADLPVDMIDGLPGTLLDLMHSYTGLKVQVYDHGPETAAGIVFSVGDDFVKLVTSPDEMVHYPFFHIRSIRLARGKKDDSDGDNKDGSGSGGNKSGGGKSGGGRSGGGKSGGGKSGGGKSGGGGSGGRGNRGGRSGGGKNRGGSGGGRGRGGSGGRGRGRSGGGGGRGGSGGKGGKGNRSGK